ncbi:WbqC family protein [uncultured Polaribacter sp.]|uniref:WbqC family protein n=1 Tax=uncultured Polaribacter sp. TaxID=174711 RepID=UPI002638A4BF|nr:WbqC family protein [uncultured Polaribacter sp.]
MNLGIMQPYFFPYIGYFQLIESVDTFILYENVSFNKKSWITRNRILDKGKGSPFFINVPVNGKSSKKLIKEIEINGDNNWKEKLLNLIFFNYKKANYFSDIYPPLEDIINSPEINLHLFNSNCIIKICKLLDIRTNILYDNSKNQDVEEELVNQNNINKEDIKSQRIIKFCKKFNSKTYINPIGGTELYDKEYFKKNGLELLFVNTKDYSYEQFNHSFNEHLSIIDILMHTGIEQTKQTVKEYNLI